MAGGAHDPDDDSGVLDGTGGVQQARPGDAYLGPGDVPGELREPFALEGNYIVIQKTSQSPVAALAPRLFIWAKLNSPS